MGVRRDRIFGFSGPRRWSFDFDEFLMGLFCLAAAAFLAVAGWIFVTGADRTPVCGAPSATTEEPTP
jgi:hypothetical protein